MAKNRFKSERGFTLVEVLVAMSLLGICVIGLFSLLVPSTKLLLNTNLKQTARNLATSQLEYIKNLPYDDSSPNDVLMLRDHYSPEDLSTQYPGLTPHVFAARVRPSGSTNLDDGVQKITITVSQSDNILATLEGYKAVWYDQ